MRTLTADEIARLEANGCRCRHWQKVSVCDDANFNADEYLNVTFSGVITLSDTQNTTTDTLPAICNVHLHNCHLGSGCIIRNCGTISFSNPMPEIRANVLDETGSKAVRLFPALNAQLATLAMHSESIRTLINTAPAEQPACNIGAGAVIEGATLLKNTIVGSGARIGANVIAENCIIAHEACVDRASHISNCFVGQNTILSNFTAQHSLFFANSHLCNGEAASVLAGPFTVSEHKSTLLIGAQIMMFNAGSGTNQSNHLYKLGPIHYGSMGRGCKCASDSYVMWPARIGDFTMVSGRHYSHPDTHLFPFSYLLSGTDGTSILLPAENIAKCGTARDIAKWPARDRRTPGLHSDIINFAPLNPVSVDAIVTALRLIRAALATASSETVTLAPGTVTPVKAARKAIGLYTNALRRYFSEKNIIQPSQDHTAHGKWLDLSGAVLPATVIQEIENGIARGCLKTTGDIISIINKATADVPAQETRYAAKVFAEHASEIFYAGITPEAMREMCLDAEALYLSLVMADAEKEAEMAGRPTLAQNDNTLGTLRGRLERLRQQQS